MIELMAENNLTNKLSYKDYMISDEYTIYYYKDKESIFQYKHIMWKAYFNKSQPYISRVQSNILLINCPDISEEKLYLRENTHTIETSFFI